MIIHSYRIFDNAAFPYQIHYYENSEENSEKLFNLLDNAKRGPDIFWYERMRRIWGTVAFYSLYNLSELIKLISWIFGVKILRSSQEPDL